MLILKQKTRKTCKINGEVRQGLKKGRALAGISQVFMNQIVMNLFPNIPLNRICLVPFFKS